MIKQYLLFRSLTIFVAALLVLGSYAYADTTSQFNHMIKSIHAHRVQMELKLGLSPQWNTYPHATSYYDDLGDHYEQVLLMSDFIDKGIR
jgi:hypothetical protein